MDAASPEDFLQDPINKWTGGSQSVVWCRSPSLCGAIIWGRPTASDMRAFTQCLEAYRHALLAPPFPLIIDARALERIDPLAEATLGAWLLANALRLRKTILVQIGLVALGPNGWEASGVFHWLKRIYPYEIFTDIREGVTFLACADAAELVAELDALAAHVQGVHPTLRRVRRLLRQELRLPAIDLRRADAGRDAGAIKSVKPDLALSSIAGRLGYSGRDLQRHLRTLGSGFTKERDEARVEIASELILRTDEKIATIADRVGLKEDALRDLFSRQLGVNPDAYRRTERAK